MGFGTHSLNCSLLFPSWDRRTVSIYDNLSQTTVPFTYCWRFVLIVKEWQGEGTQEWFLAEDDWKGKERKKVKERWINPSSRPLNNATTIYNTVGYIQNTEIKIQSRRNISPEMLDVVVSDLSAFSVSQEQKLNAQADLQCKERCTWPLFRRELCGMLHNAQVYAMGEFTLRWELGFVLSFLHFHKFLIPNLR